MFSSGWKPQCCSDFNSGWEGVRQCHEHAAFNPPWHSYNLLWWRNRHGEHCIRKCKWRACKLWSCCCLVPSNGRFQNTRTFVLLTKLSLSHSLLKWFSMFLMANLCKSKWEWPGQRPEPRLRCVSELADFSYGCWFLSFSGSVWPGFQQCSFSRKDSKCQHWALGEVFCKHVREEELSCLLPPVEVPSSLCQNPLFPGCYLKEIMVLILSKPQLSWVCPSSEKGICTKGRLPGGKHKWLLAIMHSLSQKGTAHLCLSWHNQAP